MAMLEDVKEWQVRSRNEEGDTTGWDGALHLEDISKPSWQTHNSGRVAITRFRQNVGKANHHGQRFWKNDEPKFLT